MSCPHCSENERKYKILLKYFNVMQSELENVKKILDHKIENDFELIEEPLIPFNELYEKEKELYNCQDDLALIENKIIPIKTKVDTIISTIMAVPKYLFFL